MAGKRYSQEEIVDIVAIKDSGKDWAGVKADIDAKYQVSRGINSLKIIYKRAKSSK